MTTRSFAMMTLTVAVLGAPAPVRRGAAGEASVSTILGNGTPGFSEQHVNNPYGLAFGPDGALYFCDLDNQRIRRLDVQTRSVTTVAGSGRKGYSGDGGPALDASLSMPHEIRFDAAGFRLVPRSATQYPNARSLHEYSAVKLTTPAK